MKHTEISPQRYRWVIVAASFLMVFVCLGFCSSSKSLYLAAITEALGIKRSLFSINDSCRYIATAVVNLFFGALCARFGRKRLIAAGFACLIASMPMRRTSICFIWAACCWALALRGRQRRWSAASCTAGVRRTPERSWA